MGISSVYGPVTTPRTTGHPFGQDHRGTATICPSLCRMTFC
jgi:hypothetical protein